MAAFNQPPAGSGATSVVDTMTERELLAEILHTNRAILLLLASSYGLKDSPDVFLAATK